ncbi:PucR family transcriptional regulator [Nonomuraea basaltis]|uniref:PucR family transcriptional regulator n=1 Tax=Nonomuraea basaltis TaxID=2495887 RepID=UPI00110C55F7|nr:helix-turn-helix domain-containing protein [Nonomuraea basaltis]TMR92565.1 hypothetical protein EJK15_43975 [Nonomuraea basaltis]
MTIITVRDLLNDQACEDHHLLGGAAGLDHVVRNVALVHTGTDLSRVPPSSVAVVDISDQRGVSSQHLVEVFCRRLHGRGGRMLMIVGYLESITQSTIRLADRFSLPVVAVRPTAIPGSAPALAARMLGLVQNPELLYARAATNAVAKLATADTVDRILAIVSDTLRGTSALVNVDGRVAAGELRWTTPEEATRHPSVTAERFIDHVRASCPVPWTDHQLWLVAEVAHGGPMWQDAARATLQTAALSAAAWVARDRLGRERDRARLSALLAELLQLEHASSIPEHLARRAARAGIVLDGWHVGFHIAGMYQTGDTAMFMELTPQLTSALTEEGFDIPLFERADGWSSWVTTHQRLPQQGIDEVAERLRHALSWYNATYAEHRGYTPLVAGLGQPSTGPNAIAATLGQAQHAALASKGEAGTVESIDDVGPARLLSIWFRDEIFQTLARNLLAPLLAVPDSRALLTTLDMYLATRSPTETAKQMQLHRNTVHARISAVERLLGTSIASMDCLTLHLACRTVVMSHRS